MYKSTEFLYILRSTCIPINHMTFVSAALKVTSDKKAAIKDIMIKAPNSNIPFFISDPRLIDQVRIPDRDPAYPLRMYYKYLDQICTVIDVDERYRRVRIKNFVPDLQFRAFGRTESPTFEEYEAFLESRCFPRERDKMKLMLNELGLPFYDPMLIIGKTKGRMAEDDFSIEIER